MTDAQVVAQAFKDAYDAVTFVPHEPSVVFDSLEIIEAYITRILAERDAALKLVDDTLTTIAISAAREGKS